ncbi:hypothetical protein ZIOFF_036796 [Zingiber officinale]|uniref:ATP-dependent Clp protease proteolytic subunit n=1 Tax=Zingiber officinale TaxID=94328 RepID=A0A8J5GNK4_ZINOF|nr:hypothetical protein ZIOFF_036796 [Zingiber officinale]
MSCAWRQLALYRYLHPSVERAAAGPRSFSDEIFSRLFNQRIVCINGPISDDTASVVIGQLLFLQSESSHDPIRLRINSPGGTITAGLAIYDTVRYISTPISTLCIGQATSIASLLLAAGTPGKRYALPHSRIMIHQPTGEPFDKATGIAMHAKEILKLRGELSRGLGCVGGAGRTSGGCGTGGAKHRGGVCYVGRVGCRTGARGADETCGDRRSIILMAVNSSGP